MEPSQSPSRSVRLTTWNMDHWKRSTAARQDAWRFLRERVRADVALLQEASPPNDVGQVVFREGGMLDDRRASPTSRGWGSAVVSFGPTLRPIHDAKSPFHGDRVPLLRTFPGAVAIAEVDLDEPLVVVSAYGVIDRGYAEGTVHRILSDLTPLVDERRGKRIVIAGDLNITTQWSAKHKSFLRGRHEECLRRDHNLFERFTALGFHNIVNRSEPNPLEGCDCSLGEHCRHVRTQRHERSVFPWQNDYIFVTADLLPLCKKLEVLDEDPAWSLSGHCPIVVEVRVSS
jgi:endonuclease/exonuclease/phosphatase family metal-dependent hydrolase